MRFRGHRSRASARVEVRGGAHTSTDANGDFTLTASPDRYQLSAAARGYAPITVAVDATRDVRVQIALESLDSPKLRQIGEVTVSGRFAPIVGTIPSLVITRSDFDRLGEDRIIDGLQTLP